MFKFNSQTFYNRHKNEVNKYVFPDSRNLHILSKNSIVKELNKNCEFYSLTILMNFIRKSITKPIYMT